MSSSVRLRPWQHTALTRFLSSQSPDFLAVATPGAGKTTYALVAARLALAEQPRRVVVVTPTAHLKMQWARAAAGLQLHLDPAWSASEGGMPSDMHGVVTTYQQVATNPLAIRRLALGAFVILDEVHHGAEERAWGEALQKAFGGAWRRLCLSGTPFRSDTRAIPFVRYHADQAVPDFEYGYGDALRDGGVVRPIYFPQVGGHMEWSAPDGVVHSASFDDPLANQRLRTALSLEGDWLPSVLSDAVYRLKEVRRGQPNAGGLVIATDQEHARGIAGLLVGLPRERRRRHFGRPDGVGAHSSVRQRYDRMARCSAHGVRESGYPTAPSGRVCHFDYYRPILPPSSRPLCALGSQRAQPARVVVSAGRPAPADVGDAAG